MRFMPKILLRTDSYLLTRFPTVWSTRVHIIASAGIILTIFFTLLAFAVPAKTIVPTDSVENIVYRKNGSTYTFAAFSVCLLLSVACLVFHGLDYANAPFKRGFRGFSRLWLYVVNLCCINAGCLVVAIVMYMKDGFSTYTSVWELLGFYGALLAAGAAIVYTLPSVRLLPFLGVLAVVVCAFIFVALIGVITEKESIVMVTIGLIYLIFLAIAASGRFARRNRFTLRLAIAVTLVFAAFVPIFLGILFETIMIHFYLDDKHGCILLVGGIVPILVFSPLIQFLLNRVRALPH